MNDNLLKFIEILTKTQTECGPHEAAFGLLEDMAKQNTELVKWIEEEFNSARTQFDRSDLARIAVVAGKRGEFENHLRIHDQWEDSDFESL